MSDAVNNKMIILILIKQAFRSIWTHKVRAFLTMLGIIIGVSSVITLIGMGEGVKKEVVREVENIGSNLLVVLPGSIEGEQMNLGGLGGISPLDIEDKEAIAREIPEVKNVAAIQMLPGILSYEDQKSTPFLLGSEQDLELTRLYKVVQGHYLTGEEVRNRERKIVIGKSVAENLFGEADPLGKIIKINQEEFEVVGIIESTASSALSFNMDYNQIAVIPLTVSSEMFDTTRVVRILMEAQNRDAVEVAKKKIEDLLLQRHAGNKDFSVLTQEDMLSMFDKLLKIMTGFISGIAAISLLVGGVGIMNIMLVSVAERTREIGIRKAVGATPWAILWQFLVEAVVLSVLGAILGLIAASGIGLVVESQIDISPVFTLEAILLGLGLGVGVGIIFGIAPAIRAARKDPIEALRYE